MRNEQIQKVLLKYLQQLSATHQSGTLVVFDQQLFVYVDHPHGSGWVQTKVDVPQNQCQEMILFADITYYAACKLAPRKLLPHLTAILPKYVVQNIYDAWSIHYLAAILDNQFHIFTPTQVIDVRTGDITTRDPQSFALPLAYDYHQDHDPKKVAIWQTMLSQVFPEPETLTMYFEMMGLSFIANRRFATAYFVIGEGATGKTTLVEKVLKALHHPYLVSTVPPQLWRSDSFSLKNMVGKLVNIYGDSSFNRAFEVDAFKMIVEGGELNINVKYKASFKAQISALLISLGNTIPPIKDMSLNTGVSRRIKIIPMNQVVTHVDPTLDRKIIQNQGKYQGFLSYLFAQAVQAVIQVYQRQALTVSPSSEIAMEDLRLVNSDIATFLASDFLRHAIKFVQNQGNYGIKWMELPRHYATFCREYQAQEIRPYEVKKQIQFIIKHHKLPSHLEQYVRNHQTYLRFKGDAESSD